jgi:hypothetical protein
MKRRKLTFGGDAAEVSFADGTLSGGSWRQRFHAFNELRPPSHSVARVVAQ